jgi:hypothetical protein
MGVVFCLGCGREYEPFALADDESGPPRAPDPMTDH